MTGNEKVKRQIGILGAGPSALFLYKRLIEAKNNNIAVTIFERKAKLGMGMPYSNEGASKEHITNVSDNEIPLLVTSIVDWIPQAPKELLERYDINISNFNSYKVLPRLFFGEFLAAQFDLLLEIAEKEGISTTVRLNSKVVDIKDLPAMHKVAVYTEDQGSTIFDEVVICTGHHWPSVNEGKIPRYFDSPYPPTKLLLKSNHPVAIKGSSLTAVDAIKTLARCNGDFLKDEEGNISYQLHEGSEEFKLVLHSRSGLLPAVRFHLEDTHLHNDSLLTPEELAEHRENNDGFLSLDYIFEKDFKAVFREKNVVFYEKIKSLSIEEFVSVVMDFREKVDPFQLLMAEYQEAEKSIRRKESVYWKEMLAVLSFAMNQPAKYLSAEDMLRLQKVLMPLISIVIAFIPQGSCRELIALYKAGLIKLIAVGNDSEVIPDQAEGATYAYQDENGKEHQTHYQTFVDATGQPHLSFESLPFPSLLDQRTVSRAKLRFADPNIAEELLKAGSKEVSKEQYQDYFLTVPGLAINDYYQVLDYYGAYNERIYMMAVPYIGGFNPDYSGLDFGEAASAKIVERLGIEV
jgi:uncharacterized NAD(P)/FAD-binding protein YdhS